MENLVVDPASLLPLFARWLPAEDHGRHPTYAAIVTAAQDDDMILEMAAAVPRPQLPVNLLLASVHFLLLQGNDHPLGEEYRSVRQFRGLSDRAPDVDRVGALFSDFLHTNEDEVRALLVTRATQTNEPGRCAGLFPAMCAVGNEQGGTISHLDVGCSMGLNLLGDHFAYQYGDHALVGDPLSPITISSSLRGGHPPLSSPIITRRLGLDLNPLDPANSGDTTWLLACLWPDDLERFARHHQLYDYAATQAHLLELHQGDMTGDLPTVASLSDSNEHLVITNSWVAAYLPVPQRAAYAEAISDVARSRPLTWLSMEHHNVAADMGLVPPDFVPIHHEATVLVERRFDDGGANDTLLAELHPHGVWIDWRD